VVGAATSAVVTCSTRWTRSHRTTTSAFGNVLPSDDIQGKLERSLEIDLTESGGETDTEWEGGSASGSYTLGDVVERKD